MYPCQRTIVLWAVVVLHLMVFGLPGTVRAQAQDEDNVHFVWAFEALVVEGGIKKQVQITKDMTLKTGDQLKMFVELRKPCFVYVIHHGAQGESRMLFPYNKQQFTTDYRMATTYEIPPEEAWFRLNEQRESETFFLLASAQRLANLEKLIDTYTAAKPAEQSQADADILAELENMMEQHRLSGQPGRPVPIAGNMRKGIEGHEITAHNLYIKTFTIEHR